MSEAEKRGVGRPQVLPDGTRHRSIRLTDGEWEAVLALVKRLRRRPPAARKPRGKGERP